MCDFFTLCQRFVKAGFSSKFASQAIFESPKIKALQDRFTVEYASIPRMRG